MCQRHKYRTRHGTCRGLLAAAAQDDEGEGGAVNALDSASAAGDVPEVCAQVIAHFPPASSIFVPVQQTLCISPRHEEPIKPCNARLMACCISVMVCQPCKMLVC